MPVVSSTPPATKKTRQRLFDPESAAPFRLSRTKIDLFLECPRCFYLDRRQGVSRPDMPGFSLNIAVDALLKKEFDSYRAQGRPHPLMVQHGINAIPFTHEQLNRWRHNATGVEFQFPETNLVVFGAVDDVWIDSEGTLIVVDYKATSTSKEITLDGEYKDRYKRQMEFYQWLLRRNSFTVSDTGYFVYVNALKDRPAFDARLDCTLQLIPYTGSDAWVQGAVEAAHNCLRLAIVPTSGESCDYCRFARGEPPKKVQ